MSRPKTKNELLQLSQANNQKLLNLAVSFPSLRTRQKFPEGYLNRNITDVLAHLHHRYLMVWDWYSVGMVGKKPDMPTKGYTWKTLPDLNRWMWEKYK